MADTLTRDEFEETPDLMGILAVEQRIAEEASEAFRMAVAERMRGHDDG